MMRAALLVWLWLLAAAPAAAAQPAPTAPASAAEADARLAAVRRLMDTMGFAEVGAQVVVGLEQHLVAMMLRDNPHREGEVREIVRQFLIPEFVARIHEIEESLMRIWADAFTVEELDQLTAFYGSPLGRKAQAGRPQIAERTFALALAWGGRIGQEAIAKHQSAIRARGIRI
jgi:hypothetical protein